MGLFDLLGIGGSKDEREARSVRKLQKKATEKYGPKENRQGAIEELGELRTPRAIEALLMRYTVRVEPSIAVPVLKSFVLGRDEISWPLKALSDLLPEPEMVAFLVEALRKAAGEYSRVPEKKVLLLHALAQHQSRDAVPAALPFLEDMDDEVQIAAAQAMAVQKDERAREPLIQHFLRAHEGSNARVREALAGLLADTQFDVKGYTPKMEAALPPSYKLDSKARVVRKG